ncbi:MAG: hypothetical protein AB7F89_03395 [Pirellulaceae bacterium]
MGPDNSRIAIPSENEFPISSSVMSYNISVDQPTSPNEPLPIFSEIPRGALVVTEVRADLAILVGVSRAAQLGGRAIGVYYPKLGGVVVALDRLELREGQIVDVVSRNRMLTA